MTSKTTAVLSTGKYWYNTGNGYVVHEVFYDRELSDFWVFKRTKGATWDERMWWEMPVETFALLQEKLQQYDYNWKKLKSGRGPT